MKRKSGERRGSSLVITLMIVVLLTTVLLAAFVKVQLSKQASRSNLEAFTAERFSQNAAAHALGLLQTGTKGTGTMWVSQPGKLTRISTNGSAEEIPLYSGAAASANAGANINSSMMQNPQEGVIAYDVLQTMPLAWIYTREDGSLTSSTNFIATNKIIGRYAFWVDDESTKINVNTAWTRGSANTNISHPSRLPLMAAFTNMSATDIDKIADFRTNQFFNTPMDVLKAFGSGAIDVMQDVREAKFWTTHLNGAPDASLTHFGAPKIVLTTDPNRVPKGADGKPKYPYLNRDEVITTLERIENYLARTTWPMAPAKSFQGKFMEGDPKRLRLLSLNILQYVICKESPDQINQPQRIASIVDSHGTHYHASPSRRFRMTEIGIWRNAADATKGRIFFVLNLPKNAGLSSLALKNWRMICAPTGAASSIWIPDVNLQAGEYKLCSIPVTSSNSGSLANGNRYVKFYTPPTESLMFDTYPTTSASTSSETLAIPITVSAAAPGDPTTPASSTGIQTISVDDPFLGGSRDDWKTTSGINNFANVGDTEAMRERSGLGRPPTNYQLGQDLDASGNITDDGMVIPPPAGTGGNPGYVQSLAELGHIHTGAMTRGTPSVPWRTLRLQPRHPNATVHWDEVPDWAVLDLFALPLALTNTPANPLIERSGARGGMVNLNVKIEPFSGMKRTQALEALLLDQSAFPPAERADVVDALRTKKLAQNSGAKGKESGIGGLFQFPGEIAEISTIADGGERSEARLTEVVDLVATKSSAYSIYSIGQSLIQSPDGRLTVRGESTQVTMVERVVDSAGGAKFQVVLSKRLGW